MRGLGDTVSDLIAAGVNPIDAQAYAPQINMDPSPIGTTLAPPELSLYAQLVQQGVNPIDAQVYDPTGAAAAGYIPGSATSPSTSTSTAGAITAASQIAAALSRALAPTPGIFGGTPTSCPAGYVYGAPGASVAIAPGVATVGTGKCLPSTVPAGIIPGVSNTTLGIAVFAVIVLMMMGKKR
jgi:hypothetical protein